MTIGSKVFTLIVLWLGIGYSTFGIAHELYVQILLMLIAVGVTIHILIIKTVR